jgi:hypothetical protein
MTKHTSSGDSTRQRTTRGAAMAASPSVRPKLTRLLPTALPSASDCAPTMAARALTTSSGTEVANATSTNPVTNGESPNCFASPLAPLTTESPPSIRNASPSRNNPQVSIIAVSSSVCGGV